MAKTTTMESIIEQAKAIATAPTKKNKTGICACGCEAVTKGGTWYPGHDSVAKGVAIKAIREGKNVTEALAVSASELKATRTGQSMAAELKETGPTTEVHSIPEVKEEVAA
jgi:hypothetical protein